MIYYSFYLDRERTQLVYRTTEGYSTKINDMFEQESTIPKTFDCKESAEKDFWKLLFDNEDYRLGTIFGLKKEKDKKASKKLTEVKATNEIIKAEPSIIYTDLERNKVYNEDCLLTMGRMPKDFVDIIITSPPYNVGDRLSCGINNHIYKGQESLYDVYQDEMSNEKYEEWLFKVIYEMIRVTRKHVFFNIQMLGKNKRTVLKIFGEFHMFIKDRMIWNKKIAPPNIAERVMNSKFEDIIIFSNDRPEIKAFSDAKWNRGSFNNVIEGINATKNKHKKANKATYPLYFPRTILNYWGNKGELIYDPFNGTGTTGDACVIERFDYIASELDPFQCEITNKRIQERAAILSFNFDDYEKEDVENPTQQELL